MSTAVLLAWSSPSSPESDDEFNRWYEEVHAPQVKASVGKDVTLRRYRLEDSQSGDQPPVPRYLAVYEFSDVDVPTASAALIAAFRGGQFDMSPAIDAKSGSMQWYAPHGSSTDDAPAQKVSAKGS